MQIAMTVTRDQDGRDVFRLETNPEVDVCIIETDDTGKLKEMFSVLLSHLLKDDVKVVFKKTEGYTTSMYEDVCREYIDVLNREIIQARQHLIEEGLCKENEKAE